MRFKHGCFLRRSFVFFLAALSATAPTGCGPATVPIVYTKEMQFDEKPKTVIIVSFDGLRPDAVAPAEAVHLMSMSDAGVTARSAKTVVPSLTLPSHTSMLTGVGIEKHGITWNNWDPSKGLVKVTTLFDEAKKAGLRTAMIVGKEKFRHLDHPGSVDTFSWYEGRADVLAKITEKVIRNTQPHLVFIHFAHADSAGHEHGWMSSDQLDAIHDADQAFGRILRSLQEMNMLSSTAIIATADHGGSGKGHGDAGDASTTIPWFAIGAGIPKVGKVDKPLTTYDTAATAAALLGVPIPASWDGKPAFE